MDRAGTIHLIRPIECMGAHVPGHNHHAIGMTLLGGLSEDGEPEANYTPDQIAAAGLAVAMAIAAYPGIKLVTRQSIQRRRGDHKDNIPVEVIAKVAECCPSAPPITQLRRTKKNGPTAVE